MRRRAPRFLTAFVLALVPGCGDGAPAEPERAAERLSLIWISLDTLRADHLGTYGYERDTSPFIDRLAERGTKFDWAVTPQNSTLPTHLTMFTGIHSVVHGIFHNQQTEGARLAPSVQTLPMILRDAGYVTRGWADGGKMAGYYGFARGFEQYDDRPMPFPQKLNEALAALERIDEDQPFFFLIHTYEIHSPYEPPPPYDVMFAGGPERSQAERDRDAYDGSIRFVDDQLRRFVGELGQRGILDRTVITITGDHGENFAEYGIDHIGHGGNNLHQNITRVPWIIVPARGEPGRGVVEGFYGLIDFPNTMLTMLGLGARMPGSGVDALGAQGEDRGYVSITRRGWSLYADGMHLLESETDPGPEHNALYDVVRDPKERERLDDPEKLEEMRQRLNELREALLTDRERLLPQLRQEGELPADTRDQLRALGYVDDE